MTKPLPLTVQERRALAKRDDRLAWLMVAGNLGLIALAFALPVLWSHPVAWMLGAVLLGGRILGLSVLNHDAAHGALFTARRLNHAMGVWLFGALPNIPHHGYRRGHLHHHRAAGTAEDPDLALVRTYPAPRDSILRKLRRDVTGMTGLTYLRLQARDFTWAEQWPFVLAHGVLFGLLWVLGAPEVYLLWWLAYVFVFPVVVRLRIMGEHGAVPDHFSLDPRLNTRTTLANPLERLLIAPNYVNYHVEHHALCWVPPYRLKQAHALLQARGYYEGFDCVARGYGDVLRRCTGAMDDALRAKLSAVGHVGHFTR